MRSYRHIAFAFLLIAALLVFTSCAEAAKTGSPHSAAVAPVLKVTGDVKNEIELADFGAYPVKYISYHDEAVPAIEVLAVLEDAAPEGKNLSVFFSSPDGVMAEIPYPELDSDSVLLLTDENGWIFYSERHPKQTRIKNMDKIVVCAEEPVSAQKCFRMIYGEEYLTLTFGELFRANASVQTVLEGEAQMNGRTANAYTRRELIPLSEYASSLGAPVQSAALAYFWDGSQKKIELDGYLEWRGNSVDYIGKDGKSRDKDIIGVWIDAPEGSITDIASLALDKAQKGSVLIIEIDGLGLYNLLEHNPVFLSGKNVMPIRTVMPSISNVALAAIVTGEPPSVNGVTERKLRSLSVDDMFKTAAESGKKCAVVEGQTALVNMSVEQTLNPDTNNDGSTDSEVQVSALKKIKEGFEFIYVHFHGFDDVAHTYGPSSDEAQEKLAEIDAFIAELCGNFKGTVIITADHGQHTTADEEKPGNHGEFVPVDMTVPLIIFEAGQ